MVPRAGLEPAQRERRGILNPLCLPIPPPGHALLYRAVLYWIEKMSQQKITNFLIAWLLFNLNEEYITT